ncbi:MAG: hypothetical protein M3261_01195 [Thermoproteota archaeon]|nr:hypothetical protein [Thermoproteota archaeon]
MKAQNITYRFIAVFTFAIGLSAILLWSSLFHQDNSKSVSSEIFGMLTPAHEVSYMIEPEATPTLSNQFMIVVRPPKPSISSPIKLHTENENLIEYNCGTILITIDSNRKISINGKAVGTLDKLPEVTSQIKSLFQERARLGAYQGNMESLIDIPEGNRVYKTVLINPSSSLTYAEVIRIIELVKDTGAKPIGISVAHLPS